MQNDWLGISVFYKHLATGSADRSFWGVVDYDSFEWDYDGLRDYLDYGYSVFGNTPVKNIKIEREGLTSIADEELFNVIQKRSREGDVLDLIKESVQEFQKRSSTNGIVLPLSGGLDSRILASFLTPGSDVKSFTYGTSYNQSKSYEVVNASWIASTLGISWTHITLDQYHSFISMWLEEMGPAMHAHGMYHMEFFSKLRQIEPDSNTLLSGLIGDAWAGAYLAPISHPRDVTRLGYTHGMKANSEFMIRRPSKSLATEKYFEIKREYLADGRFLVIEAMRFKMLLLQYLIRIPEYFGMSVHAPFIEKNIALSMLSLSDDARRDRRWMREYFEKVNLSPVKLISDPRNFLNRVTWTNSPGNLLDPDALKEIVSIRYVTEINKVLARRLTHRLQTIIEVLLSRKTFFWRLDFGEQKFLWAYNAYLTLLPLQEIIKRRDFYLRNKL